MNKLATNKLLIAFGIVLSFAMNLAYAEWDEVDSYDETDYDHKWYSAAGCGSKTSAVTVTRAGAIFNTSATASNDITCPVILDRLDDGDDGDRSFWMRVFRASGALAMPCYVQTCDWSWSCTTSTQNVTTTGVDSWLYFFRVDPNVISATIGCAVPKTAAGVRSGIRSYDVYEY